MPDLSRRATALVAATLALSGCDAVGPGDGPGEPLTELPRSLTVAEQSVIANGNRFGLDLVREVVARDPRANVVLSPFSASMALGMTLNGADGGTFDDMRATLGFAGLTQDEINESYAALIELLTGLDASVTFDVANSVWANELVPFHQAFLDALTESFDARSETRDFTDPATLDAINGWVDDSTNGLIEKILDTLDPDLVMLLINAIYFEGAWTTEFDPADTHQQAFERADGSFVQVPMMTLSDVEVPTGGGPGWQTVELLYGRQAFSMLIVVPDGDARDFVATLDADRWDDIVAGLAPRTMDQISIPKLRIEYDAFLNDALRAMGMQVAFEPGADFTRMSPAGDQICIDFVRQKTFLEVDEEGTRAAAVTAVGIGPTSFNGLVADRPFVFAIRERLSGTVLFVGLIGDPTAPEVDPEPYTRTCM